MMSKEQGTHGGERDRRGDRTGFFGVGRQAESSAMTVCLLACLLQLVGIQAASAAPFSLDDIQFWVGEGASRAALVVDWVENADQPPALAWGYRWGGEATGHDMLTAIVAADERLFAKLGDFGGTDVLYGIGYDADDDGEFGVEGTYFDEDGLAFSPSPIYQPAPATDPDDYYAEGWFAGFWHYGAAEINPYNGGVWDDTSSDFTTRDLVDGSWDSWAFQLSTIPPFTSYAENPQAAAPPWTLPGDYDGNGIVDNGDYERWKLAYGSASDLAADGNDDGVVDAADYTVWRDHVGTATGGAAIAAARPVPAPATIVPEPSSAALAMFALLILASGRSRMDRPARRFHAKAPRRQGFIVSALGALAPLREFSGELPVSGDEQLDCG